MHLAENDWIGTSNAATRSAQFTLGILLFLLKFSHRLVS